MSRRAKSSSGSSCFIDRFGIGVLSRGYIRASIVAI
jgi:hypothetical protein